MPAVNSQAQLQSRLPSIPQQLPQTQADWNAFLATLNQWGAILQQQNHPPNIIPSQFQTFTTTSASAVIAALSATNCTPSVDNSEQFYGGASLKVVIGAAGATLAFTGFPISIAQATRWFCALQILAPSGCTASLTVSSSAGHSVTESFIVASSASWQQVWGLFDLRQYPDTQATWTLTFTSTATVWLDGMQMNAVGSPIGILPKFAGTQMVLGSVAYATSLDGVPDGSTYARHLASGLTSGVTNTEGIVANGATQVYTAATTGQVNLGITSNPATAVISVNVPAQPVASTVVLTVIGNTWVNNGGVGAAANYGGFNSNLSGVNVNAYLVLTGGTAVVGAAFMQEAVFSLPANTSATYTFYGYTTASGSGIGTVNTGCTLKAEVILR